MKRQLILVGGGGHCKSVAEVCRQSGVSIKGILDRDKPAGTLVSGIPVIGSDSDIPLYSSDFDFIVTVGFIRNVAPRARIVDLINQSHGHLASLISPRANVASDTEIGEGSVVLSGACINAGVRIGANVIINTLCAIEHDVTVGDFSHISTGAMVNGDCRIGSRTFIGSNATIVNGVTISSDVIIGAGSTVISDLIAPGIYAGTPAKPIHHQP